MTSYAVNMLTSNRWPGAVTVAKGGKFCNIYIGDGLKRGDQCFSPNEPPKMCSDPTDSVSEIPEPQGKFPDKPPTPEKNEEGDGEEKPEEEAE